MKKFIAILSAFLVVGAAAPAPAIADDPVTRFLQKMTKSSKANRARRGDDDRHGSWSSNRNSNSSSNSSRNSSSNSNSNSNSNSSSNSNSNSSSNSNSNSSSNSSSDDD